MSTPPTTRSAAAAAASRPSPAQVAAIYPDRSRPLVELALKCPAKLIVMYAEKGGVGKTTQAGSLAFGLAQRGKKVLLYDCDAQRSLSNWLLSLEIKEEPFDEDYNAYINRQDLPPADNARPRTLYQQLERVRRYNEQVQPAYPIPLPMRNLWLVPGDRNIIDYDSHISAAEALVGIVPGIANIHGSVYHALIATAVLVGAEYIIVDLNPSR